MVIKAFDNGDGLLHLETDTSTETTRVGLLKNWGGTIGEFSFNGTNYVNTTDPGREVQTSLWDGNLPFVWNPVEAGNSYFQGSTLLDSAFDADSLYTSPTTAMPLGQTTC
jgi:hypothetical protein